MNTHRDPDAVLAAWLADGPLELPADTRQSISVGIRTVTRHRSGIDWPFGRVDLRSIELRRMSVGLGSAAAVLVVAVVAFGLYVNKPGIGALPSPTPSARPTMAASPSVEPTAPSPSPSAVAGRIFCRNSEAGTVLDCSRDGTRLLIQKGDENLFVVHADGSETQVTDQLSGFKDIPGSGRPAGATISPDGSRVVFAGLTKTWEDGHSCHDGALFGVDADGGPAELLWETQVPQNGIVRYPTFSPDGTQIAFVDGYCDHDHSVWVMNADGSDAQQIVANETTLGAGHVYGLAWSAAGDRIALSIDYAGTFTFATDGSDFTRGGSAFEFCWPGRQC
jgi:hypothetical protein